MAGSRPRATRTAMARRAVARSTWSIAEGFIRASIALIGVPIGAVGVAPGRIGVALVPGAIAHEAVGTAREAVGPPSRACPVCGTFLGGGRRRVGTAPARIGVAGAAIGTRVRFIAAEKGIASLTLSLASSLNGFKPAAPR